MRQRIELAGQRFGRLTVISYYSAGSKLSRWKCRCDCGIEKLIRSGDLLKGRTQSCGCLHREVVLICNKTHGMAFSSEYGSYNNAKTRCTNPDRDTWKDYGGRGIKFRFESFEQFYSHIGPKPTDKHSLDRIDNEGHYELGNVRWATGSQQAMNQRHLSDNNTSGFRGVSRNGIGWVARIRHDGKTVRLGTYRTIEAAAKSYDKAALEFHGEFAHLNFPQTQAAMLPR